MERKAWRFCFFMFGYSAPGMVFIRLLIQYVISHDGAPLPFQIFMVLEVLL